MAEGVFTPYSTVAPFFGVLPSWVPLDEQERIAGYQTYEEIYWNHPETFKLLLRGSDTKPLYIPSGRVIVETMNRYTATGLGFDFQSANEQQRLEAEAAFNLFFARTRFFSRFASAKRFGLIRGDWLFHVMGDGLRLPGRRISLKAVDPGAYFPVYADNDPDRLVKVHLAEQFTDSSGKILVRRQTYEYVENTTQILTSLTIWEPDKWRTADAAPVQILVPPTPLPPQITTIPVYHIPNQYEDGNPYGSSEMRGIERLMAGINQSMTDEDITLALNGLGVYKSAGGPPVDENNEDTDWEISPGRVVEDESFERVEGVKSVVPYLDHVNRIYEFMLEATGATGAARGKVDVQVAESGISLAMQMAPTLARAAEKNNEIGGVLQQMMFDLLTMWFPAYEGLNYPEVIVTPRFGNPLPVNEKAEIEKYVALVAEGIMSKATARENLAKIGVLFAADEFQRLVQEAQAEVEFGGAAGLGAGAANDQFNARVDAELGAGA